MAPKWRARPYKYADGVPWNDDGYELFVLDASGEWVSVGGAIRNWSHRTVAFLCPLSVNRSIRTPRQAQEFTDGLFVVDESLMKSLKKLKELYSDPLDTLAKAKAAKDESF